MKFPLLAIEPKGFTSLFPTESDARRMPIGFIKIYRKRQAALEFFDSDGGVWALEAITPIKAIPFWLRFLPTFREIEVEMRFRPLGAATPERMKQLLRSAVEADDDILTQHQEESDILAKLEKTKSVGEVFRLYRWMTKDFRKGPPK